MANSQRHNGAALVRSLVVGSSTFAILLICFSMYQATETSPAQDPQARPRRLPEIPTRLTRQLNDDGNPDPTRPAATAKIRDTLIGASSGVSYSLYSTDGMEPWAEISCKEWVPVHGVANKFQIAEPEIRLRTKNGHGICARSREGTMEGEQKGAGRIEIHRGRLFGNVVIEIDRLTEEERKKLPPQQRGRILPEQIVRIELDDIVFDREYAKVIVDGPLKLTAHDATVKTSDLEVRFNESLGRIEYCRIGAGGRIELKRKGSELGVGAAGLASQGSTQQTLGEWIRSGLEAGLAAKAARQQKASPEPPRTAELELESDVPIFDRNGTQRSSSKTEIWYHAWFEGAINAAQFEGDRRLSRLLADTLDIKRLFGPEDREEMKSAATPTSGPRDQVQPEPDRLIVLSWDQRLVVNMLSPEDDKDQIPANGDEITAVGNPVQLENHDGRAECSRLVFWPDSSEVKLVGKDETSAWVRSPGQGWISGREIFSKQNGEKFELRVSGPGFIKRGAQGTLGAGQNTPNASDGDAMIEFARELEVHGRVVTRTGIGLTSGFVSRKQRVIESAVFRGRSRLRDGNTSLAADHLTVEFDSTIKGNRQAFKGAVGKGNVELRQGKDLLTCDQLDVDLTSDADGRPTPKRAVAIGNVYAEQGTRTIRAKDRLVIEFEPIERSANPSDSPTMPRTVEATILRRPDTNALAKSQNNSGPQRRKIGVKRLVARTDVHISDPAQQLEVSADFLDCTVVDGRDIETAVVKGTQERPASVRIEALTVVGREITLDMLAQRADVPGEGRMTFLSTKDLDGRVVSEPIPISISWTESMRYRGDFNEARFIGHVHATSQATTTFDCNHLLVEFRDVVPKLDTGGEGSNDLWIFSPLVAKLGRSRQDRPQLTGRRFAKEPIRIVATDNAIAVTSEVDPVTGKLVSRARIQGPKLSVDLRDGVSKMLIEQAGNLLLEDFSPAESGKSRKAPETSVGLFDFDRDAGPSKTLIQWKDLMWYDFAHNQTQFEGDVSLKHFSGEELRRRFTGGTKATSDVGQGRSTFLACERLTVDFLASDEAKAPFEQPRMGGLSASRFKQFKAQGSVQLSEPNMGLWLGARRIVYERRRDLLAIYGTKRQPARIVVQRAGELPTDMRASRFFYNLKTGKIEATDPIYQGR